MKGIFSTAACALALTACATADDPPAVGEATLAASAGPPAHSHAATPQCNERGRCDNAPREDTGGQSCADDDAYEENDGPGSTTAIPLAGVYYGFFAEFDEPADLHLCSGDDDWFHLPASQLDWPQPYLFVRAQVSGSGLCGAWCGDPVLPDAPENTLTVEVYHAATLDLLTTVTSTRGNVWITDDDPRYVDDLLLRFSGPPEADYDYRFHVDMRAENAEDECEC